MLGPDSRLLTALLVIASVALLVGAIRFRLLPVKALCGALSIMVAMTGGIAAVNFYYGYYTTWGALWTDFHGGNGNLGVISAAATTSTTTQLTSGTFGWVTLPGKLSGYSRRGLLYLPPQYGEARYARVRFPVVELFHGTPGTPLTWNTVLKISQMADSLIAEHAIGPMILVMPAINGLHHDYQDCVNSPTLKDDTYLTVDVRSDLLAHYRVSSDPYEWGVTGYSSGGYCAANLALRHRGSFGAAAVIEGYFRAADGPAGTALKHDPTLETANSPLYLADQLTADGGPVPAFWVAAGTRQHDYQPATLFTAALSRVEQVPFYKLDAADTANAWAAAVPEALTWLWQQLAPPDLRVQFPVRGHALGALTLPVQPVKDGHHHGQCAPAKSSGSAGPACGEPPHGHPWNAKATTAVSA
jgi:poly(3-hydroxybutyrate) depolymerase